jgi:zinc protease
MRSALVRRLSTAAIGAALFAVSLAAATPPTVKFTDTKLKNGLRVIVNEDHVAPVFAVAVVYNVGSRDERPGRTGFAHLFEHMMFKGSENVGPGEHFYSVFSNGGSMNGTTNKERTLYYEELPANQLDMALFLEADRMRSLSIEQGNLDNQRQAVQEERRQGVDNQPYGRTFEALDQLAFDNLAYKHSVIGSMDDLSAASVEDVAAFFKTYYAPNNAILSISGDVNTAAAIEHVRNYFEAIPSQPDPPPVDASEPAQTSERRLTLEDPLARAPRIDIAYHIPSSLSPDDDAIDLLSEVLATGRSSRFYEVLVRQKQLALAVGAFAENSRGPRLFHIVATVPPGKATDEVEAGIYAEIERLKAGPVADWEIEKSRNGARRQFVGTLNSSLSRASILAELTRLYGDPAKINTLYDRVAKLNANDVVRVAKEYLTTENRVVVVTMPKAAPAAKGGGR